MGKSTPAAPDYTGAANAQAAASEKNTTAQTWANRPTLNTPWGSQTWDTSSKVDPSTGQPVTSWTSNINLSPEQQASLDSQMAVQTGRSQAAEGMLDRATGAMGSDIDYSGISAGASGNINPASTATADQWRQQAQQAALDFNKPLQEQRRGALESQLANMGLTRGSAAWNKEMGGLSDQETRDNLQVFDSGRAEALGMSQMAGAEQGLKVQAGNFNQTLRQQQIAEMLQQRQTPLNELNALLTGQQVASPNMPSFSTAGKSETPQYMQAAGNQYGAALDASNAQNAGVGNFLSGASSIGSAALMFSDVRLKSGITPVGRTVRGHALYSYTIFGKPQIGVLAQEVALTQPDAVHVHGSGALMVDYSKV